jgi:hypothetical protein
VWVRGHNDIKAICNGIVWFRILSSGPLGLGPLGLPRAADRSDHFGLLRSYSAVYSDSTYIQGAWATTVVRDILYTRGVWTGVGYNNMNISVNYL